MKISQSRLKKTHVIEVSFLCDVLLKFQMIALFLDNITHITYIAQLIKRFRDYDSISEFELVAKQKYK